MTLEKNSKLMHSISALLVIGVSSWGPGMDPFNRVPINSQLTHMVYLLTFLSYSYGSKSVSTRPRVRPRYDAKYHS